MRLLLGFQVQNLVEVRGKMLDHTIGIFGVKIYNEESFDKIKKQN